MKVLSLFSGIGAFEKALDNLEINYDLIGYCEIDRYASKSYSAIHMVPESMNIGDITKVDEKALPKDIDLITYGFPCQDISNAGKMKGLFDENGKQTRSGLFFEALRIIEETKPRVAIAENVKNLTSKRFSEQFGIVLDSLESAGYNNYYQVLNAKDFGIPQNRERVFIVSIRKDIDSNMFDFPKGFPLDLRLKDILEEEVEEKYYLSSELITNLKQPKNAEDCNNIDMLGLLNIKGCEQVRRVYGENGISPTLNTMQGGNRQPKILKLGNINSSQDGVVVSAEGISPTHTAGHGNTPKVLVKEATKKGYAEAIEGDSINLEHPKSQTRRDRVGHQVAQTLTTSPQQAVAVAMRGRYNTEGKVEQNIEISNREYSNAITTVQKDSLVHSNLRIRKLTPKECFRLMGFDDSDFEKAAEINSSSQLYKQAGNSIVVDVLYYIFKELFNANIF